VTAIDEPVSDRVDMHTKFVQCFENSRDRRSSAKRPAHFAPRRIAVVANRELSVRRRETVNSAFQNSLFVDGAYFEHSELERRRS
jgi:hypothetical protein